MIWCLYMTKYKYYEFNCRNCDNILMLKRLWICLFELWCGVVKWRVMVELKIIFTWCECICAYAINEILECYLFDYGYYVDFILWDYGYVLRHEAWRWILLFMYWGLLYVVEIIVMFVFPLRVFMKIRLCMFWKNVGVTSKLLINWINCMIYMWGLGCYNYIPMYL